MVLRFFEEKWFLMQVAVSENLRMTRTRTMIMAEMEQSSAVVQATLPLSIKVTAGDVMEKM
jgi:hypothetical protein